MTRPYRLRSMLIALGLGSLLLPAMAQAVQPARHLSSQKLEVASSRSNALKPYTHEENRSWNKKAKVAARALTQLQGQLPSASVSWDPQMQVPRYIVPAGAPVPDSIRNPQKAEDFAQDFLNKHLNLLAPGASVSDFVLVSNDLNAGIRSLGFQQMYRGNEVIGGQISFRFKHGKLVQVVNLAFPNANLDGRPQRLISSKKRLAQTALEWVQRDIPGTIEIQAFSSGALTEGPFILPLKDKKKGVIFHKVWRTKLHGSNPSSEWTVYVDANDGQVVARQQTLLFIDSEIQFNVPPRYPEDQRLNLPVPGLNIDFAAAGLLETDIDGLVDIAQSDQGTFEAYGPLVQVQNADGPNFIDTQTFNPGGLVVVDRSNDELEDAQLITFYHTQLVKRFVQGLDAELPWLYGPIQATVNIQDVCNAYSDGNTINFFKEGSGCANTGRLADVVYHEFGHSIHSQTLIPGVGFFDVATSEGISDYLAMTLVNDSGMGRGFFLNGEALRELDPDGFEYRWPEEKGQVHAEGRIIGGALWDLRKKLIAKYGYTEGVAETDHIWYQSIRRSTGILSMYDEALLADDDDGNLQNGTPNICEIIESYASHGLYQEDDQSESIALNDDGSSDIRISLTLENSFPQCDLSATPKLSWKIRNSSIEEDTLTMTNEGGSVYSASIPRPADGSVLQYAIDIEYASGGESDYPLNFADPYYEHYVGPVTPIACTSFESGPPPITWEVIGDDIWDIGPASSGQGGFDPSESYDGDFVMGTGLTGDGSYPANSASYLYLQNLDVSDFENVRLQYWRWLSVEDAFFDNASIVANDQILWSNFASSEDWNATRHHWDGEWRFHDLDLTSAIQSGEVSVAFGIESDAGLQYGGWTLDKLCIVGADAMVAVCGDGMLQAGEECDDGNLQDDDGCSSMCTVEEPDSPEEGGEGEAGGEEGDEYAESAGETGFGAGLDDTDLGTLRPRACGCSSSGDPLSQGSLWLLLACGVWFRRRSSESSE